MDLTACSRRAALAMIGAAVVAPLSGCSGQGVLAKVDGGDIRTLPYRYGQHPSQYAELSLAAGSSALPVVVVVHGGYWQAGYGAELGRPLAADLAARGFAAVNVEYRRVGRSEEAGGGGWPQTGDDVANAVDALKSEGVRLAGGRLDLTRVIGLGHSAGGQLVGWAAARQGAAVALTGVVLQAGVLDLVSAADEDLGAGAVVELMGGPPNQVPQAYAQASPIARLPLRVPSICVHGVDDTTVPIDQSLRFVAAARQAGDTTELQQFDGDHFDPITLGTPAWDLCVRAVTDLVSL